MYRKVKVKCGVCGKHIKKKKDVYKEYEGRYCCMDCKDKIYRDWSWGEDDL
jgi:hypothetical protein